MGLVPVVIVNSKKVTSSEELQTILMEAFDKSMEVENSDSFVVTLQIHAWVGGKPALVN
jgi:hypothetical protein